jgi:RHS repeat-associated protein
LSYDPNGRLFQTVGGGTTTQFLYDGVDLIGEYSSSGTLLHRYVHGAGDDEPMVWYQGSGTTTRQWLLADSLGSVITVTNASGTPNSINSYDDYGIPGSSNAGRFQFAGQAWIPEIGLYHDKARTYSPTLGRFLQSDPIGYGDGLNFYAYVHNDSINLRDPTGLFWQNCGGTTTTEPDGTIVITAYRCWVDLPTVGVTVSDPPLGGGGGGGGGNVTGPPQRGTCSGPAVQVAPVGAGGTAFFGPLGVSGSIQIGVSLPVESLVRLSPRGVQAFVTLELDPMAGWGEFLGGGNEKSVGASAGPLPGVSTAQGVHVEGGGAVELGAEGGGSYFPAEKSGSVSGPGAQKARVAEESGGRAGEGGYFGGGPAYAGTLATPQLGCPK